MPEATHLADDWAPPSSSRGTLLGDWAARLTILKLPAARNGLGNAPE